MLKTSVEKKPLNFNEYSKYEISDEFIAFEILFKLINQNDSDDLEAEYLEKGYKLFHSELMHAHQDKYNLKLIVAKTKGFTF